MRELNIAIIGGGSIGALKPDDKDGPNTKYPLTHAHAVYDLKKAGIVNQVVVIEPDKLKSEKIKSKWNFMTISDIIHLPNYYDIISICCPTEFHWDIAKIALNKNPKMIIFEKPFCKDYIEAEHIIELAKSKNIKILVNYLRRYVISFDGQFSKNAKISYVIVRYNRGFKHEGCHAVNLCNHWLGKFIKGAAFYPTINDNNAQDLTCPAVLYYDKCTAYFIPVDGRDCSMFEIEIMTSEGMFRYESAGNKLIHRPIEDSNIYGNYKTISDEYTIQRTAMEYSLKNLYTAAMAWLESGELEIGCTGEEALRVHEVYKKLGV